MRTGFVRYGATAAASEASRAGVQQGAPVKPQEAAPAIYVPLAPLPARNLPSMHNPYTTGNVLFSSTLCTATPHQQAPKCVALSTTATPTVAAHNAPLLVLEMVQPILYAQRQSQSRTSSPQ